MGRRKVLPGLIRERRSTNGKTEAVSPHSTAGQKDSAIHNNLWYRREKV